jgi:hypothetical protein
MLTVPCLCGYLLARSVHTSRAVALAAGLLIPITIMPVFQGESAMLDAPLFNINPYFSDAISYSLLTVAALWHLSARWSAAHLAWLIAPLVCFSLAMASQPPSTALMVPVTLVYGKRHCGTLSAGGRTGCVSPPQRYYYSGRSHWVSLPINAV